MSNYGHDEAMKDVWLKESHEFVSEVVLAKRERLAAYIERLEAERTKYAALVEAADALANDYEDIVIAIRQFPDLLPSASRKAKNTPELDRYRAVRADLEHCGTWIERCDVVEPDRYQAIRKAMRMWLRYSPCPGIEIEPGVCSGCNAHLTNSRDCPTCGPFRAMLDDLEASDG